MKISSVYRRGETTMVVDTERGLLDVKEASKVFEIDIPTNVRKFIESGDKELLPNLVEIALRDDRDVFLVENSYEWAPVVLDPEKILCVGLNYRRHAEETGNAIPTRPILFSKFNNSLAGHDANVVKPELVKEMDYEAELAIVIGKTARNVSESDALAYVFGYAVANDISARDLQNATSQWLIGKTCDNFAPIGPYLVTADSVPNPNALRISSSRNGMTVQDSNTEDMIFDCKQIISYASKIFTLKPGDIILTGTPEGVIMGLPPEQQVWLQDGDEVITAIDGLGELRYTVIAEKRDSIS